jgi:hypothetical protein
MNIEATVAKPPRSSKANRHTPRFFAEALSTVRMLTPGRSDPLHSPMSNNRRFTDWLARLLLSTLGWDPASVYVSVYQKRRSRELY